MNLNPEQEVAVRHDKGPLLVLAGAGSGKTRVIAYRIANLIREKKVSPAQILAVTFTNKAAAEMRGRAESLLGDPLSQLWIGTFHSICLKILRHHAEILELAPTFTVYDERDQRQLMREVLKTLNIDASRLTPDYCIHAISRYKDQLIPWQALTSQAQDPYRKKMSEIYRLYDQNLRKLQALDFGDLIFWCVRLFEKHRRVREQYQERFRHILIDEYQDTNPAQFRFIQLLAEKHESLIAVGDPDQSIYRWRGADISNILNFERDFAGAKLVRMEENYRSTKTILAAASAVIVHNRMRKEKGLWTRNGQGPPVIVARCLGEKQEADYVVAETQRLQRQGHISFNNMAIFYRTNAQSRPLEEALRLAGIPYIIYGGIRFYERAEIKDALAYLRILVSSTDAISMKRVLKTPPRGIGATTVEKIDLISASQNVTFEEAMRGLPQTAVQKFLAWLGQTRTKAKELSPAETLQWTLEGSGYLECLTKSKTVEAEERLENINELVASLADFSSQQPAATLRDFLDRVALLSDTDQESETGVLPLMTLHLAKGLEFSWVAIVGLEEGLLPHSRSIDEPEELEEERRLFYVGMTRAEKQLLITHSWRRYRNGRGQLSFPSRFLKEIPESYVQAVNAGMPSFGAPQSRAWDLEETDWDQRPLEER